MAETNTLKYEKKSILKLPNVEGDQEHTLALPPRYKGSEMFMPTGERVYWLAEVLPSSIGPETCQDFEEIRSRCLSEGVLFEDPEFPASDRSLFRKRNPFGVPVTWLRPRDLVDNPKLFVKGSGRFDVVQGSVGDCWVDAAMATLTMRKNLFGQVVPHDQGFGKRYAGVFHFRFWQYGRWVDVVIDDRLPTNEGQLMFLSSSENNEFWEALLEKAYAKLYGSYEALEGGDASEAIEDFCGGLSETYKVADLPINFFSNLLKAYERKSLVTAAILKDNEENELLSNLGLINEHAYSVTCVKYLDCRTPVLRIRNPWGDETEWKGAWSDKSPQWNHIPQEKKESLGLTIDDDGEFWMSFKDFTKYFSDVSICNLSPSCLYPEDYPNGCSERWEMFMFEGEWVKGETEGAGDMDPETFWLIPYYVISLAEPDEKEETCTLVISLMQKYHRTRCGVNYLDIYLRLYRVDEEHEEFDAKFFDKKEPVAYIQPDPAMRGFTARFKLEPGSYVIVPFMSDPDEEGEFLLRVLARKRD